MRPRPHLTFLFVIALAALCPSLLLSQTPSPLNQEQLAQRIEALRPFACDESNDTRTQKIQAQLMDYQKQLKTLLQTALQDTDRQKQLAQLSAADRDMLSQAWAARIAALDTACPGASVSQAVSSDARSASAAGAEARTLSIPVPSDALPLANKVLGLTTTAPASTGNKDVNQAVIRGLATKRAASFGEISADHGELIFGPQDVATQSAAQPVKITNTSGHDLFLIGTDVPSKNFQIVESDCGSKLPNDANCTLKVAFEPFSTAEQDMLSSLLIKFTKNTDGTEASYFPVTLRGSAIHWKFPFTRAVAGLDVSAISSKPTNFHYFVEFNLTAPVGVFRKGFHESDPLDSRMWVFLNPRITSIPSTSSAIDNLNPSLDSLNSLVTSNLTKVSQGVDANLGIEFALLKPRNGIGWWSDFPNSQAKLAVSAVFGGGSITPFSSDKTQQNAVLNQSILEAYPGQISPLLPTGCVDATTNQLLPGCFISFLTPERSRFFRKYYAGLRFKTFFFNEDVPGVCSKKWTDSHSKSACSAPYNIFPGTFDFTVGQDESVTGGSPHGLVWRLDAVYPLHFLPALHVFGSIYGTFQKNQNSRPFVLDQPASTDVLTDANTVRFVVPVQNRDYYRIGLGIDLIQLFKRNDAGQPGNAMTPPDAAKSTAAPNN